MMMPIKNIAMLVTAVTDTTESGPTSQGDIPVRVCKTCASQPLTTLEMTMAMIITTRLPTSIVLPIDEL